MYSNFGYIKIDPQYYLFSILQKNTIYFRCVLDYYFFDKLLKIKNIIEGVNYRFKYKREGM